MTAFRLVSENVADLSATFKLLNRHSDAPFDEARFSGALYAGEFWECTEEAFDYFLEIMPPVYVPGGFAVREAVAGSVYNCFFRVNSATGARFFCVACDRRRDAPTSPSAALSAIYALIDGQTVAA